MNSTALRPRGGPSRGGIQKRGGGGRVRVDRDGDLDMDAPGGGARGGGARGGRGGGRGGFNRGGGPGMGPPRGPAAERPRGQGGSGAMRGNPRRDPVGSRPRNMIYPPPPPGRSRPGETHMNVGPMVEAKVYGWKDSKGSMEDCVAFLERKSRIKFIKTSRTGDCLNVFLPLSKLDQLIEWDNAAFASAHLRITPPDLTALTSTVGSRSDAIISAASTPNGSTIDTIKTLEQVLANRYNVTSKFLDLSKLGDDPLLKQNGFFELSSTTSKMFPALMQVADKKFASAQQKRETVVSVSLAYNGLKDIRAVTTLAQTFPDLKNLSLQGNEISTWAGLEGWRSKFRGLEQLVLMGNPICRLPGVREEAMRRWSALVMLDNVALDRTVVKIGDDSRRGAAGVVVQEGMGAVDEKGRPVLPLPVRKSLTEDPSGAGMEFLSSFFNLYDTDKPRVLSQFYEPTTTFSLSVNASAVRAEATPPRQYWDTYIPRSRNLTRITHHNAMANRLYIGPRAIGDAWDALPTVRHNLAEEKLWSFDVWPHEEGMIACVHGEFEECGERGVVKRSFDRTFVLRGGVDGGVKVGCDMLVLRAYGGYDAWKEVAPVQAMVAAPGMDMGMGGQQMGMSVQGMDMGMGQSEEQQKMAMCTEFARKSGLTMEFAQMCLSTVNWDLEKGWAAFVEANTNGQLPAEAFDPKYPK